MENIDCKKFNIELTQELTVLKQMLNTFKRGPMPVKYAIYINIISYGVRFRNHLQHNLNVCNKGKYEGWFKNRTENDNIIKFIVDERNRLEHESIPKANMGLSIIHLSLPKDLGDKPPNAKSYFMDFIGAGWNIQQPDGSIVKSYVPLPEDQVKPFIIPTSLPHELKNMSIDELLTYFVNYLEKAFKDVEKEFN